MNNILVKFENSKFKYNDEIEIREGINKKN